MLVAKTVQEVQNALQTRTNTGFVPTMGALHKGHLSLIKKAKNMCDFCVVSIFVNPTQFSPTEDLSRYPRPLENDLFLCEELGVDLVFLPQVSEIYSTDEPKVIPPKFSGFVLEGAIRQGHFDGVLSVVLKLTNIVNPKFIFFGKKDAQQLFLVQKMFKSFFVKTTIIPCEIVRDDDNLAFSSRNIYLSKDERSLATNISKALFYIKENKDLSVEFLKEKALEYLSVLDLEYLSFVDLDFKFQEKITPNKTIVLIAAKVGKTRLIDNIYL